MTSLFPSYYTVPICCVFQAHHCRSMIPCQDSPSVKHSYYAQVAHSLYKGMSHSQVCLNSWCPAVFYVSGAFCVSQVSVPKDLVAVMSAVRDGQEVDPQDINRIVYRFRQPVSLLFTTVLTMRKMLLKKKQKNSLT